MKRMIVMLLTVILPLALGACGASGTGASIPGEAQSEAGSAGSSITESVESMNENPVINDLPENFVLIGGGAFQMGSPSSEAWRSADETEHTVTVSDFYMGIHEVTQVEYTDVMDGNPSMTP